MASPVAVPKVVPGLSQNGNWRRLWLAQTVSLTGDSVFTITVMLWVSVVLARSKPWAPAAASGVLLADAIPVLAVGPIAGVWIDRRDKRRIMMTADASRAAIIASLLLVAAADRTLPLSADLAVVYAVIAAESAFAQCFNPSRLALLGRIIAPADRQRAAGQLQATASAASIIGPAIAAPMLFAVGIQWAVVIDAASFVVSFAAIRSVRVASGDGRLADRAGFGSEFSAGLRFFMTCRILMAMSVGVIIGTFGAGAINALEVFFIRDNLHAAVTWLGACSAAVGGGAVLGALMGSWAGSRIGPGRVFSGAMIAGGVLLLGYSRLTSIGPALVILVAIGCVFGAVSVAAMPIFLAVIPQDMTGRTISVFNSLQQVANIGSLAISGFLAGTVLHNFRLDIHGIIFGPVSTIFGISALMITGAGLSMIRPLSKERLTASSKDAEAKL